MDIEDMPITTREEAEVYKRMEGDVSPEDLPTEEAWNDAKNHTHEWRLTWGLAFADWRPGGPTSWWTRFKHTGRHSHGVAKGLTRKTYKKWLPKYLKRLATEALQMRNAIESFGGIKAAWL